MSGWNDGDGWGSANKGAPLSHDVLKYYRQIKQLIDGGELGEDEQAALIANVYKVCPADWLTGLCRPNDKAQGME